MKLLITALLSISLLNPLFAGSDSRMVGEKKARTIESFKARKIIYSQDDIAFINCYVGYTTCIVLPEGETILDYTIGNKDFWVLEGIHNLAYVRPSKANNETNINLVCASGMIYSFVLREIHEKKTLLKDVKIFVELRDETLAKKVKNGRLKYVDAGLFESANSEIQTLENRLSLLKAETQKKIQTFITQFKSDYPNTLNFNYTYTNRKPFSVTAIYHDDRFTYIKCNAHEKPVIYELKDNKSCLIQFTLENNTYIIPKIVEEGYLQLGKKKMTFKKTGA